MDQIIQEFTLITMRLEQCAKQSQELAERVKEIKANYAQTLEQDIELAEIEHQYMELNKLTFELTLKANELKSKLPQDKN